MAKSKKDFLTSLTAAEMKRLLVARERIDVLDAERKKLTMALGKIDAELDKLMAGGEKSASSKGSSRKKKTTRKKKVTRRKATAGKGAAKKTTRKKAAAKKTPVKKVTRKKVARKVTSKKTSRKVAGKKVATRGKASGKIKLEDVVVKVIKANGGEMPFKDLINTIVKKKLFVSKSNNFDNVLRRTLSTSKLVKRVGRGIYGVK